MFGRHDFGQQGIGDREHAAGREPHHEAHEKIPGEGRHGSADGGAHEHDRRKENGGPPAVDIGQRSPYERPHRGAGQRDQRQDRDLAEPRPYSTRMPGVTKPRVAAFMTSITSATAEQNELYPMGLGERRILGRQ